MIFGRHFGNVLIGVQPSFGYEGDPMRLLYSRSASPHHGFAAYYTYLENLRCRCGAPLRHPRFSGVHAWQTDGHERNLLSRQPDRSLPNLYYYAANNPLKPRSPSVVATPSTISYLTPPAENAGLYKGLKDLGELVGSYQQLRESSRGVQIVNAIVEAARHCNLDKDVESSDQDASELSVRPGEA